MIIQYTVSEELTNLRFSHIEIEGREHIYGMKGAWVRIANSSTKKNQSLIADEFENMFFFAISEVLFDLHDKYGMPFSAKILTTFEDVAGQKCYAAMMPEITHEQSSERASELLWRWCQVNMMPDVPVLKHEHLVLKRYHDSWYKDYTNHMDRERFNLFMSFDMATRFGKKPSPIWKKEDIASAEKFRDKHGWRDRFTYTS